MAHILMGAMPFGGHQQPTIGVAAELVRRGHDVTYYTGAKYAHRAEEVGATWLPWHEAPDFDDADIGRVFPRVAVPRGLNSMFVSFEDVFFGTAPAQAADLVRFHDDAAAAGRPVDLVVHESLCVGPVFLQEMRDLPWASLSLSPLSIRTTSALPPPGLGLAPGRGPLGRARDTALRAVTDATMARRMRTLLNDARRHAGLPPTTALGFDGLHSGDLVLAQGVPGLDHPRPDLPHVYFVGDAAAGTRAADAVPDWMERLDPARPVVYVTGGTLVRNEDLPQAAVTALADTPAQVVVSGDPDLVPHAPNVIAPGWVPQDLLLPRTSVVVTNGGYGAVQAALAHGLPVVVAPDHQDKPAVARLVAGSGAGFNLRTARPRPDRLRAAVERCLGDSPARRAARRLADAYARAGGAVRAADLLESRFLH